MRSTALVFALAFSLGTSPVFAAPVAVDQSTFLSTKKVLSLPNGMNVGYVEKGDPNGKPLVFIHGYTDSSRTWTMLLPYLDMSHRIILVDLRGHGASSKPECCYATLDLAYDVKLLLDKLKVDNAVVVGHSLGSMVTQTLSEFWPQKVSKAVLISSLTSTARFSTPSSWLATSLAQLKDPISPDSDFMNEWFYNPRDIHQPEFLKYERQEAAKIPAHVWQSITHALYREEFGRSLYLMKAPTVIMHGAKDPMFGEEEQKALREALPNAEFIDYPEAGHNIFWEEPEAVAKKINEFSK